MVTMKIKIIGYVAGSLQLIGSVANQISAIIGGWWSFMSLLWMLTGVSLGAFIILLSTKLKI